MKKVLREFFRVLKENGELIVGVPIHNGKTFEDFNIKKPKDRVKYFGQEDHVRRYGVDINERMGEIGFDVKVITPKDILSPEQAARYSINCNHKIFWCPKRQ